MKSTLDFGRHEIKISWGSGCGSVGRAVASNSRGPWYKSRHWQKIYIEHFIVNCIEKTKIKKKRPGRAHLKKDILLIEREMKQHRDGNNVI